jgi:hypothetical protein
MIDIEGLMIYFIISLIGRVHIGARALQAISLAYPSGRRGVFLIIQIILSVHAFAAPGGGGGGGIAPLRRCEISLSGMVK